MGLSSSIYSEMAGETTITDLVGTRIYPILLPQSVTFPAIVYHKLSLEEQYTSSGADGCYKSVYRFHIFAPTLLSAQNIRDAVRDFLSDTVGSFGTISVNHIRADAEFDEYEPETELFHIILDFMFLVN